MRLYHSYMVRLELSQENMYCVGTRWMNVNMQSSRVYRVMLEKRSNYYVPTTGWQLVVVCECLQPNERICLEYHGTHLSLTVMHALAVNSVAGFANVVKPPVAALVPRHDYHLVIGVHATLAVLAAIRMIRVPPNQRSPAYVCIINSSQRKDGSMFFSTKYSKMLPKKETVALHLVGSPVAICGAIHRYEKGVTMITKGWKRFVEDHGVAEGNLLIFHCYRGPNVW